MWFKISTAVPSVDFYVIEYTKVEYTLTPLGESLMEVLDQLCMWGEDHMG